MGEFTEEGKAGFLTVPRAHLRFVVKCVKAQSAGLCFAPAIVTLVQELRKRQISPRLSSGVIMTLNYKV